MEMELGQINSEPADVFLPGSRAALEESLLMESDQYLRLDLIMALVLGLQ